MFIGQKTIRTMRVSINMHTGSLEDTERGTIWSSVFEFFKAMNTAKEQGELWEIYFTVFAPINLALFEALPFSLALTLLYANTGRKRPIKPLPTSEADYEVLTFYEDIKALLSEGLTFEQIADRLNTMEVQKSRGTVWNKSNIWKKLDTIKGRVIMRQAKRELEHLCLHDSLQQGEQAHE